MNEDELYRHMHAALKAERKEAKRRARDAEQAALATERRRRRDAEDRQEIGRIGGLLLFVVGAVLMFGLGTGAYLAVTRIDFTREPTPGNVDPEPYVSCWPDPIYASDC